MKRLFRLSAVAACLLLGGPSPFVTAQEADEAAPDNVAPDNHDLQFESRGASKVLAQTKAGFLTTSSTSYVQLTAGSISIPPGQAGYLLATFSGESLCSGPNGWCTVRLLVDGAEINPEVGIDFAFDSPSDTWESHSIQRISNLLGPGTHTVEVQWAVVQGATLFRIDDWLFKVDYQRAT